MMGNRRGILSAFGSSAVLLIACHFAVASPLPQDTDAVLDLLREFGPDYSARDEAHFTIISDCPPHRAIEVLTTAESVWKEVVAFSARLGLEHRRPRRKLIVVLFDQWEPFEAYADRIGMQVSAWVPGYFDEHSGRCVMFNYANSAPIRQKREELARLQENASGRRGASADEPDAQARSLTEQLDALENRINQTVFRHELAHQALFHLGLEGPSVRHRRWLSEGLAMQFEEEGGENAARLEDFLAISRERAAELLPRIIREEEAVAAGGEDAPQRYALAWALVRFLVDRSPKEFTAYLTAAKDHESDSAAAQNLVDFQSAFGPVDDRFHRRLRACMERLDGRRNATSRDRGKTAQDAGRTHETP